MEYLITEYANTKEQGEKKVMMKQFKKSSSKHIIGGGLV
jgi:hypothetical protein